MKVYKPTGTGQATLEEVKYVEAACNMSSDDKFFKLIEKEEFDVFMSLYMLCFEEYERMIKRVQYCIEHGENPSKNHCYKMRQQSLILEKFGKQFRSRTIEMSKWIING